jgi:hypothetical protein
MACALGKRSVQHANRVVQAVRTLVQRVKPAQNMANALCSPFWPVQRVNRVVQLGIAISHQFSTFTQSELKADS